METFLSLTVAGVISGAIYALTASGLVVTYTTSGVFNFAQGAVGTISAYLYWTLAVHLHWPPVAALGLVLLVFAPLVGLGIEGGLIRPLRALGSDSTLQVTVGLLLLLVGATATLWNQTTTRAIPEFFTGHEVTIFGVVVTVHQLLIVAVTIAVAVVLRVLLFKTRTGNAMRAVVDDPVLASLAGANPARFAGLGWAIGCMLGALAGILLAPLSSSLDLTTLTFLIVNGYAAAMVGKLRSLPLTFAGALGLGLLQNYLVGYLPVGGTLSSLLPILPMLFLFVVLLASPHTPLRAARLTGLRTKATPSLRSTVLAGAALVVVALVCSQVLSGSALFTAGHGVALGIVMLSLVLLTGFGGQVSLCQLTLAGVGAVVDNKVGADHPWLGVLAAIGVAAVVGGLISLPALRLRGLYLALATLAFAQGMDSAFFSNTHIFGSGGALSVARLHIPGLPDTSDRGQLVFLSAAFALLAVGVLALRRSSFGRRLAAMSDSETASAMLGVSLVRTKAMVFVLASALAGLGGALYAGQQGNVSSADFAMLGSLTLLLLVTVWGLRSPAGALFAGVSLAVFPLVQQHVPAIADLAYLGTGLAAVGLARNPAGAFGGPTHLRRRSPRPVSDPIPIDAPVAVPPTPLDGRRVSA